MRRNWHLFTSLSTHNQILHLRSAAPPDHQLQSHLPPPHDLHSDHNLQTNFQGQLNHAFKFLLNPLFAAASPWLFSPPTTVNFYSLNLPKPQRRPQATENFFENSSILSKNQPYVSPTAQKSITDLASPTQIANPLLSQTPEFSLSIYTTELQAICNYLQRILTLPSPSITKTFITVSDSLASLTAISQPSLSLIHI